MVNYTSWTSVVCFTVTSDISYLSVDSFIHVIIQLCSIYSFRHVSIVYMYYTRAHFPYLTYSLGVFWLPWIYAFRYRKLCYIDQVFNEIVRFVRSPEFLSIYYRYSYLSFYSCYFLILSILLSVPISFLCLFIIRCVIAVIVIYYSLFL